MLRAVNRSQPRLIGVITFLLSLAVAVPASGQDAAQLQIEVNSSGEVSILARAVSYGEALRTLQDKLGVAIEIPSAVDEMRLEYARIQNAQPEEALKKLLEGTRLGYAWSTRAHRLERVLIVAPMGSSANDGAVSTPVPTLPSLRPLSSGSVETASFPMKAKEGEEHGPLPVPSREDRPLNDAGVPKGTESGLPAPQPLTMPLSKAFDVLGVPSGLSPADVGKTTTFSMSQASRIIGVPAGVSPGDVGKSAKMPLPTELGN